MAARTCARRRREKKPPEGIEPPLRGLKPRVLPLDQSGSWTPARRLSPRLVVDDDAAVAYFCLRWNGVLRCAFDARGDGVVAAPNEAVRSLILSTRYRTKLCYGQECDHKQSGLLQTSLAGFAWPSSSAASYDSS